MKRVISIIGGVASGCVLAQAPSCLDIEDNQKRLACYDQVHGRTAPPTAEKKADAGPSLLSFVTVRDEGLPNSLPTAGPAFLGYVKNGDKEGSLVKLSAIFTGPALTHGGSGTAPFGSLSVYRDLTGSTPRNTIGARAGLRGTLFDYVETGFALDTTASVSTKEDRIKHTATDGVLLTSKLVAAKLATGAPFGSTGIPYQLVPTFGLGVDRIRNAPGGSPTGTNRFVLAGASLALWPSVIQRVQISARYQHLSDLSASSGIDKRRLNYREASIDYYLFSPSDDKAVVQPIFSISRERGDDPISGIGGVNRTMIGLKLKVN